MKKEWKFSFIVPANFFAFDVNWNRYEFCVKAETKIFSNTVDGFLGLFGYGHDEESAMQDAIKKVQEYEDAFYARL